MNKVNLIGRLCFDNELKYTSGEVSKAVLRNTLAVNRKSKDSGTDFIPVVFFDKSAENIAKYTNKGTMLGIVGRLQINSYTDKEGNKRSSTDVIVEEFYFTDSKDSRTEGTVAAKEDTDNFDDLPF